MTTTRARLITAIGTPLTEDEQLYETGLDIQLADQWNHGIDGILAAGTMGAMQLLTDETYRRLVERSVALWAGRGEILVGAGDCGFARSRDRILFLNKFKIDGVAVLTPYFWKFGQKELVEYYSALADVSKSPLYLYDLPVVTGTKIEMGTFLELANHPNIRGAKISYDFDFSRRLMDTVDESFRIITAQPNLVDLLLRHGVRDQLDGMWAIAPGWTAAIADCAHKGDWRGAAEYQRKLTAVWELLTKYGFGAFTVLMNARGIPGRFTPRPIAALDEAAKEKLMAEPPVRKLISEDPAKTQPLK